MQTSFALLVALSLTTTACPAENGRLWPCQGAACGCVGADCTDAGFDADVSGTDASGAEDAALQVDVVQPDGRADDGVSVADAVDAAGEASGDLDGDLPDDAVSAADADAFDAADVEDGGADPGIAPPLNPLPEFDFDLDGVPQAFDLNLRADYVAGAKALKIRGGKGLRKLEIWIPAEGIGTTGTFDVTSPPAWDTHDAIACYFDGAGSPNSEFTSCAGFNHAGVSGQVHITLNEGHGGRVVGTFSFDLQHLGTEAQSTVQNGVFDVMHF